MLRRWRKREGEFGRESGIRGITARVGGIKRISNASETISSTRESDYTGFVGHISDFGQSKGQ